MAGKLVQDESGQIFYQAAGGVLQPITEAQAEAFDENQDAGENFIRSANLAMTNLGTGAASLLSDDPKWKELYRLGREEAEALQLAQPMIGGAGSLLPQVAAGVATAGFGPVATGVMEAGLGAASTPESPVQGALIGGGLGVAGALAPKALGWGYQKGQDALGKFGLRGSASQLDEAAIPGYVRPGDGAAAGLEQAPGAAASGAPPSPGAVSSPYTSLADDMSAQGAQRPLQAPASDAVGDLPLQQPQRMADRVVANIEQADAPRVQAMKATEGGDTRAMGGLISPEGLQSQYGVRVTPAQRQLLTAMNNGEELATARQAVIDDELMASNPIFGRAQAAVRAEQRQAVDNFILRELDMEPNIGFTDASVSDVIDRVGAGIDTIADQMGTVPLGKSVRDEMADILEQTTGAHHQQLKNIADEILAKADRNGGALNGQEWTEMRTKLNKMVDAGTRQGDFRKISDAQEMLQAMTRQMEDALPAEAKAELKKLRKQYAIAVNLQKPGAVSPEGNLNIRRFYGNWKQNQSKRMKGRDDVGQFLSTMDVLTTKRIGDSGTATRLLNKATKFGAGAAAAAVGLPWLIP